MVDGNTLEIHSKYLPVKPLSIWLSDQGSRGLGAHRFDKNETVRT